MLRKLNLPTPNAVPPNATAGTATIDLPLGYRYHSIGLRLGYSGANASKESFGTIANEFVGDIRVKLNGKVQRTMTARQLALINASYGSAFAHKTTASGSIAGEAVAALGAAGYGEYHTIWFAEPWRKDIRQTQVPAWNVAGPGVSSFQLEVDFKSIATGVPTLSGYMEVDAPTGPIGTITKWIRQSLGATGSIQDFTNLDRRDILQALKIWPLAAGDGFVGQVKLTANGVIIQDTLNRYQQDANLIGREMTPAALNRSSETNIMNTGLFNLDIDYDDPLQSAINAGALAEMTLQVQYATALTLAAASVSGTLPVHIIRAGPPE